MTEHSPAFILSQFLINEAIVTDPEDEQEWPLFVNLKSLNPLSQVCIYDTQGNDDGRLMDGTKIEHPGIQVIVQSLSQTDGYQKMKAIADALNDIYKALIDVEGTNYQIQNVSRRGNILFIGEEEETKQLAWSMNAITTIKTV